MENKLTKEEIFEAIKQGVKEAFHEMMESGDGISGPIRTEQTMEAIKEGVKMAFFLEMPDEKIMRDLIYSGTHDAMKGR